MSILARGTKAKTRFGDIFKKTKKSEDRIHDVENMR